MKLNSILYFFLFVGMISACKPSTEPTAVDTETGNQFFGEKIDDSDVISYDEMLTQMADADSLTNIKVSGKVNGVCQAKGCWITIVSAEEGKESMFVKFKDYGFFMPKDIAGETVVMRGKAFKEVTSVEELRHYAEDEGKSEEEIAAITEPVEELKFMADGVILKKPAN